LKFSHFNLRGFSLQVSFSERTIQMFVGNIGWLKIAKWDLSIHSAAPRNEHIKTEFGNNNSEKKFGESRFFLRAILILRPALDWS
jgi:hypothetical protein